MPKAHTYQNSKCSKPYWLLQAMFNGRTERIQNGHFVQNASHRLLTKCSLTDEVLFFQTSRFKDGDKQRIKFRAGHYLHNIQIGDQYLAERRFGNQVRYNAKLAVRAAAMRRCPSAMLATREKLLQDTPITRGEVTSLVKKY